MDLYSRLEEILDRVINKAKDSGCTACDKKIAKAEIYRLMKEYKDLIRG